MPEYQSDSVTQRLDRLERENWYWRRATLLLLIVIGAAILIGQASKSNVIEGQTVKAQLLEIIDAEGSTRARLAADLSMVWLELWSKNSDEKEARLAVTPDAAYLRLRARPQYTPRELQVVNEYDKKLRAAKP